MATATATINRRSLSRGIASGAIKAGARSMQINKIERNNFKENKISSFVSESEMIDYINEIGAQYYGN